MRDFIKFTYELELLSFYSLLGRKFENCNYTNSSLRMQIYIATQKSKRFILSRKNMREGCKGK